MVTIGVGPSGTNELNNDNAYRIIVKKISDEEMSVAWLERELRDGQSFRCSIGGSKLSDWESQQVFAVDVKGGITYMDAIKKYAHLRPTFIYKTSNRFDCFRMIFILEKPITEKKKAVEIQCYLLSEVEESDKSKKNLNRVFFGGNKIVYSCRNNRFYYQK